MPDVPPVLPSYAQVNMSDLDRMATAAADRAVAGVALKQGDVEKLVEEGVEEGIKRFLERVGIDPNDLPGLRKDFAEMRSFREMKASIKDNGLRAFVTMLVTGLGVWFWAKVKGSP